LLSVNDGGSACRQTSGGGILKKLKIQINIKTKNETNEKTKTKKPKRKNEKTKKLKIEKSKNRKIEKSKTEKLKKETLKVYRSHYWRCSWWCCWAGYNCGTLTFYFTISNIYNLINC
jgi:hypothetical protein